MKQYFRPIVSTDALQPKGAYALAGGSCWFAHVEVLTREGPSEVSLACDLPAGVLQRLTSPRAPIDDLSLDRPRLMGILNVTPDSFSDGGQFLDPSSAERQARHLIEGGADILDIGGESTRPGAVEVAVEDEIARTAPVIQALRNAAIHQPISIDTRKQAVAQAALSAGANVLNDVSALGFDDQMASLAARSGRPICLMHAQGTPASMQDDPQYDDVLLDVYDFLEMRIAAAQRAGISRKNIIVDPGIGFGKTTDHCLRLIQGISLFHALGCPILLGASRKRFIGDVTNVTEASERLPGSIAVALAGAAQGVQILRVHDITQTRQALRMAQAVWSGQDD